MNRTVSATSMQIKATAGPSLVIAATSNNFTAGTTTVSLTGVDVTVMPATKWVSGMTDGTATHAAIAEQTANASVSGLVYVANGGDIDPTTGLAIKDEGVARTLYYSVADRATTVGSSGEVGYYYDYIVYLASEGGDDIESGKLNMTIAPFTLSANDPAEVILNAATVQILVNDVAVGDPIRLKDGITDDTIVADLSAQKIVHGAPGTVADAMKITMRVYVDGAFEDVAGTSTYVRNNAIVDLTRSASFDALFEVVPTT